MKFKKVKLKKTNQLRIGMIIQNHMDKLFYKVLEIDRIKTLNELKARSLYEPHLKRSQLFIGDDQEKMDSIKRYKGIMAMVQVKKYGRDWDEISNEIYYAIDNSGYFDAPYVMVVK